MRCVMNSPWMNFGYRSCIVVRRMPSGEMLSANTIAVIVMTIIFLSSAYRPVSLYAYFLVGDAPALTTVIHEHHPRQGMLLAVVNQKKRPAFALWCLQRDRRV